MKSQKIWSIVGLGWLGQALADQLSARQTPWWGTHRSDFQFGVHAFPSRATDILFLNTPPLKDFEPAMFTASLPAVSRVLFVSSTSVYGEQKGEVVESTLPQPSTDSAKWLYVTEQRLRERFEDKLTVLRPGGLIGGQRHPVYSLAGKRNLPGGDAPVNLIHREDLIPILIEVVDRTDLPLINAVAPHHPPKRDYYSDWARKLNLPAIDYAAGGQDDKCVHSESLADLYPNWNCPRLDRL